MEEQTANQILEVIKEVCRANRENDNFKKVLKLLENFETKAKEEIAKSIQFYQWEIFSIIKEGEKEFWQKIGYIFRNQTGSLNLKINCLPLTRKLFAKPVEKEGEKGETTPEQFME